VPVDKYSGRCFSKSLRGAPKKNPLLLRAMEKRKREPASTFAK
jgi:hypothetical protein